MPFSPTHRMPSRLGVAALALATLLGAGGARAEQEERASVERQAAPPPGFRAVPARTVEAAASAQASPPRPPDARTPEKVKQRTAPLSPEDAALIKELALLERVDLLRNLDLFERDETAAPPGPKRQQ